MLNSWVKKGAVALLLVSSFAVVHALEITQETWEKLQRRLDDQDAKLAATHIESSSVDAQLDSKYGPNANVSTKVGKLQIGLLTQVWYYGAQHDNRGLFDSPALGIADNNATQDNSTFRIRRTELGFNYDYNENFSVRLMIDGAREAQGYPNLPFVGGNDKRQNVLSPEYAAYATANKLAVGLKGNTAPVTQIQSGGFSGGPPRLLQDANINWHGVIPHHDITIGQCKPLIGEEGIRSSAELDFVERSMLGFQADSRDLGAFVHGSWWNCDGADANDNNYAMYMGNNPGGRFQYWAGVFNGAGTYFDAGNEHNRADTNNEKDFNGRMLVRPVWDKCMGHLELGVSYMGGVKGEGNVVDPVNLPQNQLERQRHWASRGNLWFSYKCGEAFAKGLWFRSEVGYNRDQEAPGSVLAPFANGVTSIVGTTTLGNTYSQAQGRTFSKGGGYAAIGYDLGNSQFAECLPFLLKPVELLGRWEEYQNVEVANAVDSTKTDRFYTKVWTAGMNYKIKGHNLIVQANYMFVTPPHGDEAQKYDFHEGHFNAFALNFQVNF